MPNNILQQIDHHFFCSKKWCAAVPTSLCHDNIDRSWWCGVQEGQLYNTDDGRKALRDIFALNLFENVQVCASSQVACLALHCQAGMQA